MSLRVALLNAAHDGSRTARNFQREIDAALTEFDAVDGDLPGGFDFDGIVVTGSRSSVYWEEPWIDGLVEYVAAAAERDVPILGVCFGHQVVAEALGGTVEGMGEYEIGYRTVSRTTEDALFTGIDRDFTVFTTHSDAVTALPPGADLLAENDYGVHAFKKGSAYGVQFHPEYDTETAEHITNSKDALSDERKAEVLGGINAENFEAACEAKRLFDNFLALADGARDLQVASDD
ncbi:type 1 glutamine amidotransferase [Halocalculus aciditolerans]|uniref:Glutamine amidotransferase domain-containing protein n=1 Tax=Halocalculus aciditolerans TaxID=1383812 RepID=A0A830F1Q4_9EURY|nr:type 1 glutamine amidotransferase [Halocalculus aciditolerans]GGL46548.1 hypothetical protein GCM10009039_01120 [Halocalculus aciditolerans]